MVSDVFLALGSNMGDKKKNLTDALKYIYTDTNIKLVSLSSLYITKAYGLTNQDDFFNMVCKINTSYSPFELLKFCKNIEEKLGRIKTKKWGPRKIDVDILFYNSLVLNTRFLKIPHIEILLRDFVIVPLNEIDENFVHPLFNIRINEITQKTDVRYIVDVKKFNEEEIV